MGPPLFTCFPQPHHTRSPHARTTPTGLQYLLPATWTPLRHNISLSRLTDLLSTAPAALAGLSESKGKIAVGYDADLMVSDGMEETRGIIGRSPTLLRSGSHNNKFTQ